MTGNRAGTDSQCAMQKLLLQSSHFQSRTETKQAARGGQPRDTLPLLFASQLHYLLARAEPLSSASRLG
eukprot:6454736-Amphidinium_carterae.2